VEQTACVHAVSAQPVRAAHLPADGLHHAGPGGILSATDSGSVHKEPRTEPPLIWDDRTPV